MPNVDHHPHTFRVRYPLARLLEAHLLELHRRGTETGASLPELENWHANLHHTGVLSRLGVPHWHEHPDGNPKFEFPPPRREVPPMKRIPVHVVILQLAVDPDQSDPPDHWDWNTILHDLDGVHLPTPTFITGGVDGHTEVPTSEDFE